MNAETWRQERDDFSQRLVNIGVTPSLLLSDTNGLALLAHADFDASEAAYEGAPYLMLNLCTALGGKLGRFSDQIRLDGVVRPGVATVSLPHSAAEGYWPDAQMLGVAVNLDALAKSTGENLQAQDFEAAASDFHRDPLIAAVMNALRMDAEMHGLSSAFFEQGLLLILKRLADYRKRPSVSRPVRPLAGVRLQRCLALIDSRLASNLRVAEVATEAELDVRSFTRAFRAATGYAPFEYLTLRRMHVAKQLLRKGSTVTEISTSVGYANPSKFAAAFRRINGKSPTQWAQKFE